MLSGVYLGKKNDGTIYYRSSFTFKNKHISLGSYTGETAAHEAYLEALSLSRDPSLSVKHHTAFHNLPFEKWVSIINLRDNNIYIKTPIYLKQNYFLYYLSYSYILTFDIDDLFYYSTRKIMKKQGYLFVSDYGMQVNILSRYGIKNYAVPGKDYIHINGDSMDYRYENIKVINPYYGVEEIVKKGKTKYLSKILIRGTYQIGIYDSSKEAAIAYNKAIDILKKKGVNKNYQPNYIVSLSPREYASIYNRLTISSKICHYHS